MTEAEWNRGTDPAPMLEFLRGGGKASDRELRLFACACCRRLDIGFAARVAESVFRDAEHQLSRGVLDVWERYLEGRATDAELRAEERRAGGCAQSLGLDIVDTNPARFLAAFLACEALAGIRRHADAVRAVALTADKAARAVSFRALAPLGDGARFRLDDEDAPAYLAARNAERAVQCRLLRCVFGSPLRPAAIDPLWLTWNGGAVAKLARAAYDQRRLPSGELDPARLAVLADALEDAGTAGPSP
jgi:hypothetical protein